MDHKFYAILDQDNLVINCVLWPIDKDINELIINQYSERYIAKEYSENNRITNNPAGIGLYYHEDMNAFVSRNPGVDYVLNPETYQWEIDKEV